LVHVFGATKKEFKGKGGSFAPSALHRHHRGDLRRDTLY
jgi:hypothetical protein